jgi:cyclopropane fatty-acyl-phospholipid synthase-like methyltransferase
VIVVCRGRKRSLLTGAQWNGVLVTPSLEQAVIDAVRLNRLLPWARQVLLATRHGQKVLEVGSGTGQISLQLAQAGRDVTCLDISQESLTFQQTCARKLGLEIACLRADATEAFGCTDEEFDCVWSSGLLEHFDVHVRRKILAECARTCHGRVLALVPNAASLAYRLGKAHSEATGDWPYGLEQPLLSLRDDFEAVGLHVTREYSVGARHALEFLPRGRLRNELTIALAEHTESEMTQWNQGYILITEGVKRNGSRAEGGA